MCCPWAQSLAITAKQLILWLFLLKVFLKHYWVLQNSPWILSLHLFTNSLYLHAVVPALSLIFNRSSHVLEFHSRKCNTVKISNCFEFLSIFLFISVSLILSYNVCSKASQVFKVKLIGPGLLTDICYIYTTGFLVFCNFADQLTILTRPMSPCVNSCATLRWKSPSIFTGTYLARERCLHHRSAHFYFHTFKLLPLPLYLTSTNLKTESISSSEVNSRFFFFQFLCLNSQFRMSHFLNRSLVFNT